MRAVLLATWAAVTEGGTPDDAAEAWEKLVARTDTAHHRPVRTRLAGGIR